MIATFTPSSVAASPLALWKLLSGPADPPPFSGGAIRDTRRHRLIFVEGVNPAEVWTLSLPASGTPRWLRVFVGGDLPPVRNFASVAYDSVGDRVLLFGGIQSHAYDDVWALSLAQDPAVWKEIVPLGDPPPPRAFASVVFDPLGDRMVLWGGESDPPYADNFGYLDAWSLDLAGVPAWRRIVTARAPHAWNATVAYDPSGPRMLLHEYWSRGSTRIEDVWALSLTEPMTWDSLSAAPVPDAYGTNVCILDPVRRELVVGLRSAAELWTFDLSGSASWNPEALTGDLPQDLSGYDQPSPERGSIIQFDPLASYELDLATHTWSRFSAPAPPVFPSRRDGAHLFVDSRRHDLYVFGDQCQTDLWRFSLDGAGVWQPMPIAGIGPPNCAANQGYAWAVPVFDPIGRRILDFFGGDLAGGPSLNQLWALPLEAPSTWAQLPITGPAPSARFGYSLMFDPARNRVLMFGGSTNVNRAEDFAEDHGDLWSFALDSLRWTPIPFTGGPSPRREATLILDAARDRMLLVGGVKSGFRSATPLLDSSSLPLGVPSPTWTRLGPDLPTTASYDNPAAIAFDALRDRLLMWDENFALATLPLDDPSRWRSLVMTGDLPTQRIGAGFAFDDRNGTMLTFGGVVYGNAEAADLRAVEFGREVSVRVLPSRGIGESRRRDRNDEDRQLADRPVDASRATRQEFGRTVDLAILSASDFSPDSLILSTLTLGGAHALVDAPGWRDLDRKDFNRDGIPDLEVSFRADSVRLSPGSDVALLLGETPSFGVFARVLTRRPLPGRGPMPAELSSTGALSLLAPSPSIGGLALHYSLDSSGARAKLEIFDLAGRRLVSRELDASDGSSIRFDNGELRPGMLLVRLTQGAQAVMKRVVVLP